jgi:AcrR family transcriptional regulator
VEPPRTARAAAREHNLARIKQLALRQLAESGAGELSLRAIARELDIVSSGIYRYFDSRDALLTALISDAYNDLAAQLVETLQAHERVRPRRRWELLCTAFRAWAVAQPHRFALIYGSAIPGYQAPESTIEPAGRVIAALLVPLAADVAPPSLSTPAGLRPQLNAVTEQVAPAATAEAMLGLTIVLTELIGFLTLELNGHFVGGFDPADQLFTALVRHQVTLLGLT